MFQWFKCIKKDEQSHVIHPLNDESLRCKTAGKAFERQQQLAAAWRTVQCEQSGVNSVKSSGVRDRELCWNSPQLGFSTFHGGKAQQSASSSAASMQTKPSMRTSHHVACNLVLGQCRCVQKPVTAMSASWKCTSVLSPQGSL